MGSLRFLLAISVVLVHLKIRGLVGGQVAVQSFFMISGFLITHVLVSNNKYKSKKSFYKSRFTRIYPIYLLALVLSITVQLLIARKNISSSSFSFLGELEFIPLIFVVIVNIFVVGQDLIMFLSVENGSLNFISNFRFDEKPLYNGLFIPQAWSLSLEIFFYLIAPFLVQKRKLILLTILISITSRAATFLFGLGFQDPWSYRFLPNELLLFTIGMCLRLYLFPMIKKRMNLLSAVPFVAIQSVMTLGFSFSPLSPKTSSIIYLAVTAINISFLFHSKFQNPQVNRFDRFLGELSFPIYVSHILVINFLYEYLQFGDKTSTKILSIFSSVFVSVLLYFAIIKRIERKRKIMK